jgi:hypothetical protein
VVETGAVERAFVRQAVRQAFDRGLIRRADLSKAGLSNPAKKLFAFDRLLGEAVPAGPCVLVLKGGYALELWLQLGAGASL